MKKALLILIAVPLVTLAITGLVGATYHLVCEIVKNCQA